MTGIQATIQEAERVRELAANLVDYQGWPRGVPNLPYWIDPSDRIQIVMKSRMEIEIMLHSDSGDTVFLSDSTGIQRFHPGAWVRYLGECYEAARPAIEEARKRRTASEQADLEARYAPIDDSTLFK